MKILVTGARGFVGKNLVATLKNIRDGKDLSHQLINLSANEKLEIYEYDRSNTQEDLDRMCKDCSFVFHLAGVNRPKDISEFTDGNIMFSSILLETLEKYDNKCPIMFSSSIQASLVDRYESSDYGKSKLRGEDIFFEYSNRTGVKVLVYRFPNIFGKWCKPNYNSVIATFCSNIANNIPININNPSTVLELLYIDDLVDEMLSAINGNEHRCEFNGIDVVDDENGNYCYVPKTYKATLGEIVNMIYMFENQSKTLLIPEIPNDSFIKKLYSTYLSYIPKEKIKYSLNMNIDERGSFTEIFKTIGCGQFSINISKPNITKGEHWHHSKWELFLVVSGRALIQERQIGTSEIVEFEVSGDKLEVVHMLPGYTHNIINLSDTQDLVTVIWANEEFDKAFPDTFFERVNNDS